MKIKNNNKEVIRRVTNRSLKENRINNLFAIIAIILTTFMISTIFTVGVSMAKNYNRMECRLEGTMANVILNAPTKTQLQRFKEEERIESSGIMVQEGQVQREAFEENGIEISLVYYDDTVYKEQVRPCIDQVTGSYPTRENEVMISRVSLSLLGQKDAKIGDSLRIKAKLADGEQELSVIISGIYQEFGFDQNSGHILVSEEFVSNHGGITKENSTAQIDLDSAYTDRADEVMPGMVPAESGQEYTYLFDIEQENNSMKAATIVTIVIIVMFIMFSGYLFIYNILFISVKKNIQFYGLLKTIGTSPKQLKSIVRGQVYRLAGIGIPVGMALGLVVSCLILPQVIKTMSSEIYTSVMSTDISFHPIVFIGTAVFSLLTVILSVKKPAKVASRISPIESLHYSGIEDGKKGQRKGLHGGKVYKLAWHNVFREKKRAIIVFLSLFMGITTFLMVEAFLNGMKAENYVNRYIPYDFEVGQKELKKKTLNQETVEQIKNMTGVKETVIQRESAETFFGDEPFIDCIIRETLLAQGNSEEECEKLKNKYLHDGNQIEHYIIGIDTKLVEAYNREADTKIDIEAFRKGKTALVYPSTFSRKAELAINKIKGDSLTAQNVQTKKKTVYEPIVLGKERYGLPMGEGSMMGMPIVYISLEAMEQQDPQADYDTLSLSVDTKEEATIKAELEQMGKKKSLSVESKSSQLKEYKDGMMTLQIMGGGISILLILIGILNFINVMITGVYVRFKELAMMESIGMTKKQIKKMLMIEGIYYALITSTLVGTIGMVFVRGFAKLGTMIADYAVIAMPWSMFLLLLVLVVGICMITPIIVYRISSKQTITERLRME